MDVLIPIVAAPILAEALKVWGPFAIALCLLTTMWWIAELRAKAKDAEITTLRAEISELHKLRLQDSQNLIRVAESGTSTIAARAETQERFAEIISAMARKIEALDRKVTPKALTAPRQKRSS